MLLMHAAAAALRLGVEGGRTQRETKAVLFRMQQSCTMIALFMNPHDCRAPGDALKVASKVDWLPHTLGHPCSSSVAAQPCSVPKQKFVKAMCVFTGPCCAHHCPHTQSGCWQHLRPTGPHFTQSTLAKAAHCRRTNEVCQSKRVHDYTVIPR